MTITDPDSGVASPVHIWRHLTGGGQPADYLRWLAAKYEQYVEEEYYLHQLVNGLSCALTPKQNREQFLIWLTAEQRIVQDS